jgi:hypothetical protein
MSNLSRYNDIVKYQNMIFECIEIKDNMQTIILKSIDTNHKLEMHNTYNIINT